MPDHEPPSAAASRLAFARGAHPWALMAIADLLALRASWAQLAAARVAVANTSAAPVKAWAPSLQVSGGAGPSSAPPASVGSTWGETAYLARLEERARDTVDQCRWLILDALGTLPDSWDSTRAAFARLGASGARACLAWLRPTDTAIRRALYLPDDERPADGNPDCPVCTVRLIRVRPASGLIVCTAGCRCAGESCVCGMLVRDRGAPHIWTSEETPW